MAEKISSEQYWKLYEKLPESLQNALGSDDNANHMQNICEKYKATKRVSDIVDQMARVLLGLLSPDKLQEVLEKEIGLKKETAKNITQEINRYIFYPVKAELEKLYKIDITLPAQMDVTATPQDRPPIPPRKDDVYREPIE
jgi:hypothetical protein